MTYKNMKEEIIKYVLESSDEENKNLAIFIAGMRAKTHHNTQCSDNNFDLEPALTKVTQAVAING